MEVEQLRRLVKVKRALEQLQEVPEGAEEGQGSERISDAAGACSQAPDGLQDLQASLASAALGASQAATTGVS